MQSKFTWHLKKDSDSTQAQSLSTQLNLSEPLIQLLQQRDLTTPETIQDFLNPQLEQLHDPYQLHDMAPAVERIQAAIMAGEKIVIYGDYDVDGLTSTTIMKEAIEMLGGEVSWYIPNRFTDGYGPNLAAYKHLIASGAQLIITVDNGIAGKDVVAYAQSQGVDVVVTDHHEMPKNLPEAVAVVHPQYPGSTYPFQYLSGAGVAFKVASALLEETPTDLLDLVALGTVADLVSLTGENRILVTYGLKALRQTSRIGLKKLYEIAKIDPETIDETTIGFAIGPRLNALGRMGDANEGVTLLSTLDEAKAIQLVTEMQAKNVERQKLVGKIAEEAKAMAETPANKAAQTLVLAGTGWHEGVLGIVASRLVGDTGKPTLILNIDPETGLAKGSGRSVPNFHLFNSLTNQRDLMTNFGGHHMAVGLTVPKANLDALHDGMERFATETQFEVAEQPEKAVDLVLPAADYTLAFYEGLQQLAPFGTDNPQPIFQMNDLTVIQAKTMGKQQQHLRLQVATGQTQVTAVGFGFGDWAQPLQQADVTVSMIGTLNLNHYRQKTTLQLMLIDLQSQQVTAAVTQTARDLPEISVYKQAQLTTALFKSDSLYVFFKENYYKKIKAMPFKQARTLKMFYDDTISQASKIIIVDQPENFEQLNFFLAQQQATQLTFAFFNTHPLKFEIPTRQIFSRVLVYIKQQSNLQMQAMAALAQSLKISADQLRFILKVFSQLGFVKIEDGYLKIADISTKKSLDTAPLFKMVQQRLEVEQTIQQCSNEVLNQRLQQRLTNVNQ